MRSLFILLLLSIPFLLSAQSSPDYADLSTQAYQSLADGNYQRAIRSYRKLFKLDQNNILDVMRAAAAAQGASRVEMRSDLLKHVFLLDPLEAVRVYKQHPEFRELEESNFEIRSICEDQKVFAGPPRSGFVRKKIQD